MTANAMPGDRSQGYGPKPWDRQEGESRSAFAAFVVYRDLGPERTLAAVGKLLGRTRQNFDGWSKKWKWPARVALWDDRLDRLTQRAMERAADGRAAKWLQLRDRHLEEAVEDGDLLIRQGRYLAMFPVVDTHTPQGPEGTPAVYKAADPRTLVSGGRMMEIGHTMKAGAIDRALAHLTSSQTPAPAPPDSGLDRERAELVKSRLASFYSEQQARVRDFLNTPPPAPPTNGDVPH